MLESVAEIRKPSKTRETIARARARGSDNRIQICSYDQGLFTGFTARYSVYGDTLMTRSEGLEGIRQWTDQIFEAVARLEVSDGCGSEECEMYELPHLYSIHTI